MVTTNPSVVANRPLARIKLGPSAISTGIRLEQRTTNVASAIAATAWISRIGSSDPAEGPKGSPPSSTQARAKVQRAPTLWANTINRAGGQRCNRLVSSGRANNRASCTTNATMPKSSSRPERANNHKPIP